MEVNDTVDEIINNSEMLIDDKELFGEELMLKTELLERENVQLKTSQTDLEIQVSYLHRQIENNGDGDGSDISSDDSTLDEFVSNKLVTFKNVQQLQQNNETLSQLVHEMNELETFKYRNDLETCMVTTIKENDEWWQHAIQLQQVTKTLIEKLQMENEDLQKENVTLDNNNVKFQLKIQECRKELLSFRQNVVKDYQKDSKDIKLCANQLNVKLSERTKLTENIRKLIADVKIHQENAAIQSAQIQSLEERKKVLTGELIIQQVRTTKYSLQFDGLNKQYQTSFIHNANLTKELNLLDTNIASYVEQLKNLDEQCQTATKRNEDLTNYKAGLDKEIASSLMQIQSLEKHMQTINYDENLFEEENRKIGEIINDSYLERKTTKRPNNQGNFKKPPTQNKRRKLQRGFIEKSISGRSTN